MDHLERLRVFASTGAAAERARRVLLQAGFDPEVREAGETAAEPPAVQPGGEEGPDPELLRAVLEAGVDPLAVFAPPDERPDAPDELRVEYVNPPVCRVAGC